MDTTPETLQTTMRLCRELEKTPIEIKDVAGFAVNRLLHVMMIEAVHLVEGPFEGGVQYIYASQSLKASSPPCPFAGGGAADCTTCS